MAVPAVWLAYAARGSGDARAAAAEVGAAALLLALALVPSGRRVPRAGPLARPPGVSAARGAL
jgi:hypothetical protein